MLFLIRQIIFLGGGKSELPHVRQVVNRHRSVWKTLRSQETNRKDLRKEKKKKATRRETPNDQQWYVWTDRYRKWEEEDERE